MGTFTSWLRGIQAGEAYEYRVYTQNGGFQDHCDPFGFGMELRPNHRSILRDLGEYSFSDQEWMAQRSASYDKPVNIYEIHLALGKSRAQKMRTGTATMKWESCWPLT